MEYDSGAWRDQAACKGADTDLFFAENIHDIGPAVEHCFECPVIDECLEYAISDPFIVGIFGGTSSVQRARIRKTRTKTGQRLSAKDMIPDRKTCEHCGIVFSYSPTPKRYCSTACNKAASRLRRIARTA